MRSTLKTVRIQKRENSSGKIHNRQGHKHRASHQVLFYSQHCVLLLNLIIALILVGAVERSRVIAVVAAAATATVRVVSVASVRWSIVVSTATATSSLVVISTRPVVVVRIVARRFRFNVETHLLVGHVFHFDHRSGDSRVVEHNETEVLRQVENVERVKSIGKPSCCHERARGFWHRSLDRTARSN